MSYETLIGWRFLYRGRPRNAILVGLVVSLVVTAAAAASFLVSGKPSPIGVGILTAGALASVAFGLLSILSVFTTVSVFGVVLGVAALTVVFSVTSGFQAQFRDKVLGVNAHVLVMKSPRFENYREVQDLALGLPHVVAVQPFLFEEMLITRGKGELSGVAIKGIDPDHVGTVLDLPEHMIEGTVGVLNEPATDGPPPIIIGRELAAKLKAKVGDEVTLVSPLAGVDLSSMSRTGEAPPTKKWTVRGIFYSGFDEYDRRLVYVSIPEGQDFLGKGDSVRGIEMKLDDVNAAARTARLLEQRLGEEYTVMDWHEMNQNLFTALMLQKVVLLVFLTLIIIVAAFNMVASLTMMVLDKTKEIAILKSMGGTDFGVARVFQVVGLTIGAIGTALGVGLGLLLCYTVGRYGYPLDPKVYLIDRLPVRVDLVEVALVALITIVICFFATLYPALKASALRPVEGLRYE